MSQAGTLGEEVVNPDVPIDFVTDSGTAVAFLNVLNVLGGSDITTSGSGNTITISSTAGGFSWQVVTSLDNPVNLVSGTGYIPKGASQVIFSLPPAASVGDIYRIAGYGNLWTVEQNAGQTIYFGMKQTTPGVFGSITATMIKDTVELLCVTNSTEWQITNSIGNPMVK